MKSHELAKELLDNPDSVVTASIDVSTCDANAGDRMFGADLEPPQFDSDGEVTLLFCDAQPNYATKGIVLPAPTETDAEGGWSIEYDYLEKIKLHICCSHLSLEDIEAVLIAAKCLGRDCP